MRPRTPWWWILFLYSPVIAYYGSHYAAALLHPGLTPTGFIQYDLPYSMACAREFADNGLHGLLFTLPSNAGEVGEPVLLQMHLWALGQVWRLFPVDPGTLYVLFGGVMGLLAVRVLLRLFDALIPVSGAKRLWGHVLFIWGGGVLALAGEAINLVNGRPLADTWKHLLDLDPAHGWWMMNVGRCLILPNEAYYHWLFFSSALAFVRQRHLLAVTCLIVLAASHPFAGMGGLVVFLTWSLVERLLVKDTRMAWAVPVALALVIGTCLTYYFLWLPPRMDPRLGSAFSRGHSVEAIAILPAYVLVLIPACAYLRSRPRVRSFIGKREGRMLLTMVLVQFALENHELLVTPHQPAHFTRGYTWAALFLIGIPWSLNEAWPALQRRWPKARKVMMAIIVMLFLSDNAAFFALNMKRQLRASSPGFWLTTEQRDVLAFLNGRSPDGTLVIAQDEDLGYMIIVYTPWCAYRSHFFDEDDANARVKQQAAYFDGRTVDPLLEGPLIIVADKGDSPFSPPGSAELLHENRNYRIFRTE